MSKEHVKERAIVYKVAIKPEPIRYDASGYPIPEKRFGSSSTCIHRNDEWWREYKLFTKTTGHKGGRIFCFDTLQNVKGFLSDYSAGAGARVYKCVAFDVDTNPKNIMCEWSSQGQYADFWKLWNKGHAKFEIYGGVWWIVMIPYQGTVLAKSVIPISFQTAKSVYGGRYEI